MPKKVLGELVYPAVAVLENGRFRFVKNRILRRNISMGMQYVAFLVSVASEEKLKGPVLSTLNKNILLFCASVIEGLTNYKLRQLLKEKRITEDQVTERVKEYIHVKEICESKKSEKWVTAVVVQKNNALAEDTRFQKLIHFGKRTGLFTQSLYDELEWIMKTRNRIHLASLKEVDNRYGKADVDRMFISMNDLIKRIETF